ncbi:MAG: GNAT family N-acetyltransferase [Chlorobia bacterium]|nr:GNAT family N-acetyltransferase [Fimbriimonadaceae bacterium]
MALIVRPFEDRDRDETWHVRDMTYNDGRTTPVESRVFKGTTGCVAELDGRIAGVFSVLDLTCTREGRVNLKCAGIAGVAVLPEYRHLGVGSAMMSWSVPYLRSQGYQMASLYGFRESFYRKFGYEMCGLRLEMEAPTHRLPRIKPELPVRVIDWQDHHALQACHEAFTQNYSGMNVRTPMHWNRVLDEKKTVYAVGDPVEAYAILEHKIDFWVPQLINEVSWSSFQGYRSLMAVLSQICINKSSLQWFEPSDSPYLQVYSDQGISAKYSRAIMFRVLDIPGALKALAPVGAGAFSFEVQDELVPENHGCWRVEDDGEKVDCRRVDSADLVGSIQAWTQAFLGDPGIERGPIEERESGSLASASKFLKPARVYCQEFF